MQAANWASLPVEFGSLQRYFWLLSAKGDLRRYHALREA